MQSLIQHSLKNGSGDASTIPDTDEVFDPTAYRSVHNLATNTSQRPFEDLMKKTAEAIFMSKCLKFNGFFGKASQKQSEGKGGATAEVFISSLLLRHLQAGFIFGHLA